MGDDCFKVGKTLNSTDKYVVHIGIFKVIIKGRVGGIRKMVAAVSHKNVKSVFVGKSVFENINNVVIVTRFGNKRTRNSDFHFVVKFLNHSASFVVFNTAHNVSRDTKNICVTAFI